MSLIGVRTARSMARLIPSVTSPLLLSRAKILRVWSAHSKRFVSCHFKRNVWCREREVKALSEVLRRDPQISCISGPQSSVITDVIEHVLHHQPRNRAILHLDLRKRDFHTASELNTYLCQELTLWIQGMAAFRANAGAGFHFFLKTPRLEELLESIPSVYIGVDPPIICIDHINRMNPLLKAIPETTKPDTPFYQLLASSNKHHVHVILGSSDSLVFHLLAKSLQHNQLHHYGIGHLSENKAQKFWNERVVTCKGSSAFTNAYKMCGGSPSLLEQYGTHCGSNHSPRDLEMFEPLVLERRKLLIAWNNCDAASAPLADAQPLWTQDQLYSMMEQLAESPAGFLSYHKLCYEMGVKIVHAFIDKRLLHLRIDNRLAFDLLPPPTSPILTAATPTGLYAMKQLLKDLKGRLKGETLAPSR